MAKSYKLNDGIYIDDNSIIHKDSEGNRNNLNNIIENITECGSNYVVIGDTLIIWGVKTATAVASNATNITINFPKNFDDTNYSFVVTKSTVGNSTALYPTISTKTTKNCVLNIYNSHSGQINNNYNYMIIGKVAK